MKKRWHRDATARVGRYKRAIARVGRICAPSEGADMTMSNQGFALTTITTCGPLIGKTYRSRENIHIYIYIYIYLYIFIFCHFVLKILTSIGQIIFLHGYRNPSLGFVYRSSTGSPHILSIFYSLGKFICFSTLLRSILGFWLSWNQQPSNARSSIQLDRSYNGARWVLPGKRLFFQRWKLRRVTIGAHSPPWTKSPLCKLFRS